MFERGSGNPERVRELCRRLRPILGTQMDRIFMAYSLEDADGKRQIETYLESLTLKHLPLRLDTATSDLVPPGPECVAGPYVLGQVQYAGKQIGPFGLQDKEWLSHMAIFGITGAGKTNVSYLICRQLQQHNIPTLILDWKRTYRDLLALPEFHDFEVYTVGRDVAPLYINPLIPPPGTDPEIWARSINEILAHSFALGDGVLFLLTESVNAVYEEAGVYTGNVQRWPTFRDVLAKAKERNTRGRESAWLSSTLRALASLCWGHVDLALNTVTNQSKTIENLLTRSAILEMESLGQQEKTLVSSVLLLYIHHYRMTQPERETLKSVVIIEEAHHLLADQRTSFLGGQSVMDITFREIREFGTGVILLDQTPSKISQSALANSYCTICLNLKHAKDVNAIAQSMLLDASEKDILGGLAVGQAVVKLQGRYPRPFLVQFPKFDVLKGTVTDDAIRLKMGLLSLQDERREMAHAIEEREDGAQYALEAPQKPVTGEWILLQDIVNYPDCGVAVRYRRLGISVRQGQKLKVRAVAEGLIEEVEEHTQTGRLVVLRLTEKGRRSWNAFDKAA